MKATALYSPEPARGWLPWGALAPFLLILFVAAPVIGTADLFERYHWTTVRGDPIGLTGLYAFLTIPFLLTVLPVLAWTRYVERRPLATIGLTGTGGMKTFLHGLAIGMLTILAVVMAIWVAGGFEANGYGAAWRSPGALLDIGLLLLCFVLQASVEEIIFRGWLLSVLARKFNIAIAVLVVSLVFTLLHYGPRQHWLIMMSSMLFSGFACCWAIKANNIWGVMGWHAGWNWLLSIGFELPVTGISTHLPALLVALKPQGSDALTGGAEGPEGSFICSVFFAVAIAFMIWRDGKKRKAT